MKLEQMKNLHFVTVVEMVISDLMQQFRPNNTDEQGILKKDNRLFDFISDFTH